MENAFHLAHDGLHALTSEIEAHRKDLREATAVVREDLRGSTAASEASSQAMIRLTRALVTATWTYVCLTGFLLLVTVVGIFWRR